VTDETGRTRRIVTYARPASPSSGQPGPSFNASVMTTRASGGSVVRVISTNRARRTITVTDASGQPTVLPVSSRTAGSLAGLNPGDVVGLDFANGGVITSSALPAVTGIQMLPAGTAVGGFVVPPFSGQFVGFDPNTNMMTIQGANGRQRTFAVNSSTGSSLANLRPGDNLSLNFQVTQEANRARARASGSTITSTGGQAALSTNVGTPSVVSVSNVQTFTPGFVQQGPNRFATVPVTDNAARLNAQAMGATNAGMANGGAVNLNPGGVPGNMGVGNVGAGTVGAGNAAAVNAGGFGTTNAEMANRSAGNATTGGQAAGGGGTFSNFGAGGSIGGGGFIGGGPVSPYSSTVPSIPAPTPVFNAVLPPATAKAPLSQDEVGAMRQYGERDLDAAALVLATYANEVDAIWFRYKNLCLGGFTAETSPGREWFLVLDGRVRLTGDDQCRGLYTSLLGMATGWEQQLQITLDAARRTDVLPGRIRETLQRHNIDR
jgi:hypothetical protein